MVSIVIGNHWAMVFVRRWIHTSASSDYSALLDNAEAMEPSQVNEALWI